MAGSIPRALALALVLATGGAALAAASAAQAAPAETLQCGQTITHSVRLAADLVDCPANGLEVGADGITIDLDGHVIDGTGGPACEPPPEPPPVRTTGIGNKDGYDHITITRGTIRQFTTAIASGSATDGVSDSRFTGLVLRENGGGIDLGSGAGPAATARNRIDHNSISSTSDCSGGLEINTGQDNRFTANAIAHVGTGITFCCGLQSDGNVADHNRITDTSGPGILVFQTGGAQIVENVLRDLGDDAIQIIGSDSSGAVVRGNVDARAFWGLVYVNGCADCGPPAPALHGVTVERNTSVTTGAGIFVQSSTDDVVRGNTVARAGTFGAPESVGDGISLDATSRTLVTANAVADGGKPGGAGIFVGLPDALEPSDGAVDGNRVEHNTVLGQRAGDGIYVAARATNTALAGNSALRNDADGLHVLAPTTTLTRNLAFGNHAVGIEAVAGVTDGGGNRARHNGGSAQCAGVACR